MLEIKKIDARLNIYIPSTSIRRCLNCVILVFFKSSPIRARHVFRLETERATVEEVELLDFYTVRKGSVYKY